MSFRFPSVGAAPARSSSERSDVALRPAATAMVWLAQGQQHETIAVPGVTLADGDVLVAVELSTICSSDVRAVRGLRSAPAPLVLGHESVGRVIALGEAPGDTTDGSPLRIGDRVVWSKTISCASCDRCLHGMPQKCRSLGEYGHERIGAHGDLSGAFGSHVQLRRGTAIVKVPEALPAAALAPASCATATAWAAVARALRDRDLRNAAVRVHGAGLLGLSIAAIAAECGATVEAADPNAERRAFATRFGATAIDREADVAFVTSGEAVDEVIGQVAAGGMVVLVGDEHSDAAALLPAALITQAMITVTGVLGCTGADLAAAVEFLAGRGRAYPFADAVAEVRSLSDIDAALLAASAPGAPLRIGVAPGR